MNYIKRTVEKRLTDQIKHYKAILVTGPRQVGKSTLLKEIFKDRKYVSLDDPFVEEQARENGGMFLMLNKPPVTIDEVQRAIPLFRYIKMKCDETDEKGLFCLSGSQQFHLMHNISETLSGRVGIIELAPLSLREIMHDSFDRHFIPTLEYISERKKTLKKPDNIWEVIHRGGYPELADSGKDWSAFYADYVKTYIERDIRELSAVQDLDCYRRFMVAAAARTGEMLNFSAIASEIGKDVSTVKKWISLLETSGIIYLLEPYSSGVLKRVVKSPKLYFRDTGLVCYLTRWLNSEALAYGAMSGHIFETFIVSEILKSFSNEGIDYRYCVSYYRGRDRIKRSENGEAVSMENEIDLIIEENGILYPIEIKQNAKVPAAATSSFMVLDKIEGKKRGMGAVVCMCPEPGMLRENVLSIPAWYV